MGWKFLMWTGAAAWGGLCVLVLAGYEPPMPAIAFACLLSAAYLARSAADEN